MNSQLLSPISTQTSASLSYNTPRKTKYRDKIRQLERENNILKREIKELKEKSKTITVQDFQNFTYQFCSSKESANFICNEITQSGKKAKGRRYSDEFKNECLKMYFTGPKLYKQYLMKQFSLPGPETLLRQIRGIKVGPGMNNPQLFEALKMKVSSFKIPNKYCVLCIDEMAIKANLFYDRASDCVVGLAQNESNNMLIFKPALSACTLLLRGLYSRWKQPIGYYFHHTSCPAQTLKDVIFELVNKIKDSGLNICALTTDMGSNNIQLSNLLDISFENPFFYISDQKIVYMFDIPHIFKAFRNMLLKYNFYVDNNKISWQYVVMFYEHDKNYPVRAAPKLSESHINPSNFEKMKVKFATQVFSATVAASMNLYIRFGYLPSEAIHTSDFIERMDKLFDLLNSSTTGAAKEYNRAFKGLEYQISFLKDCLDFFSRLQVRNNNNVNITNKIKCLKSIKISINSLLILWNHLNTTANFEYIFTRRLNQDDLENQFGVIRQLNGSCINPTAIQFQRSFKKIQCTELLHSGTENCEADFNPILLKVCDMSREPVSQPVSKQIKNDPAISLDYQKDDNLQKNFIRYICGYLLKKCEKVHSCQTCLEYSKAHQDLDDSSLYIFFRAYENSSKDTFGNLKNPHDSFVDFITNIEVIFQSNFEEFILHPKISESYFSLCQKIPYNHPCSQFPLQYVIKLYIRVRMYYTLKNINKNLKTINKNKILIWRNQ